MRTHPVTDIYYVTARNEDTHPPQHRSPHAGHCFHGQTRI